MSRDFYNTQEYKEKQSAIMIENWKKGVFDFTFKRGLFKIRKRILSIYKKLGVQKFSF